MARTLLKSDRMRSVLPLLLLVACAPTYADDIYLPPDGNSSCGIGGFDVVAPRAGLHYAPQLDVYIDSSEIDTYVDLELTMIDELGNAYAPTSMTSGSNPTDAGMWWTQDKDHYELVPGRRYVLTATHCDVTQTVTFFTSAP